MKKIIIFAIILATLFTACQANDTTTETTASETTEQTITTSSKKVLTDNIVIAYLELKNALAADNSKDAANAGKKVTTAINNVDAKAMTAEQKKTFDEIIDDALEQAEHITDNKGNIAHQREHFVMLSEDVNDLISAFGTAQKLYKDFCPMYDNNKGAFWISESKEIKNPYYGAKMLSCGLMKEEL